MFSSTALVSKQKTGSNFMLGSWQGVNKRKEVKNPWCSRSGKIPRYSTNKGKDTTEKYICHRNL